MSTANEAPNVRLSTEVSPALTMSVRSPSSDDPRLPAPALSEGNVLDLSVFAGDIHVTLKPWVLMAPGQRVWLWITHADGSIDVLNGHTISASDITGGLTTSLPRADLAGLAHGSMLLVHAAVSFDGSMNRPADTLPTSVYRLQTNGDVGDTDKLNETFLNVALGAVGDAYTLPSGSMQLYPHGAYSFGTVLGVPGVKLLCVKHYNYEVYIKFTLRRPVYSFSFYFDKPNNIDSAIKYYDEAGDFIAMIPLAKDTHETSYVSPVTHRIKTVSLVSGLLSGDMSIAIGRISGSYVPV